MNYLESLKTLPEIKRIKYSTQVDLSRPIVFTDIMSTWPSYGRWSLEFFNSLFGHKNVLAHRFEDGQFLLQSFSLSEFIEYMFHNREEHPYYVRTALHYNGDLRREYDGETFFPCWYRKWNALHEESSKIELSDLFFGAINSKSHLHVDIWGTSFWNALYEGQKLWLFYDDDQKPSLYNGRVDPFAPDLKAFPLFKRATPTICIQQPGELIYCPGNIFHAVYALKPSLALSENFIDSSNYTSVIECFQNLGYTKAIEKMRNIVDYFTHSSQGTR